MIQCSFKLNNSCGFGLLSARIAVCLTLLCAVLFAGCSKGEPTRLSNTFSSPEKLLQRALQAVAKEDFAGLEALCVSRYEHDSVIVPAMGKDSVDMDMAWFFLHTNIEKGIGYVLEGYGGRSLKLEKVEFAGGHENYGSIILYREPQVTVTEPAKNNEFVMTCFGTIVEENGHFKLVSIRD